MKASSSRDLFRIAALLAIAAVALSIWVAVEEAPMPGDLRITREIQSWNHLADNEWLINGAHPWRFAVLALAAGLTLFSWRLGGSPGAKGDLRDYALWAFIATAVLSFLDNLVKMLVRSPRPLADLGVRVEEVRNTYGFPSGHVYGDVLVYGVLAVTATAWVHPRLVVPVRAVCIAIIVLSGPARIAVGAHWPSDTLGGYLWGGAALAFAIGFARWMVGR